MIALNLQPAVNLTDEVFEQLCRQNPELRLERTAQGELIAMALQAAKLDSAMPTCWANCGSGIEART
jgi:hypothetical protein